MTGITASFRGRLGRDAELRYLASGSAMLSFSVAVLDDRARADDPTQWARVACFGDLAEQLEGSLSKGDLVTCEGRLVAKVWRDRPDVELYAWSVELDAAGRPGRRRPHREPVLLGVGGAKAGQGKGKL